jgi:peptidoglycan/LPS O-acetylase OafA/YrhL
MLGCCAGLLFATRKLERIPFWLILVALAAMPLILIFGKEQPFLWLAFSLFSVVLVLAAGFGSVRFFAWLPLRAVGRISYGLYLWQGVVIFGVFGDNLQHAPLGRSMVAISVAVVVACFSYRYVERPFLRIKRRPSPMPQPAPVAVAA